MTLAPPWVDAPEAEADPIEAVCDVCWLTYNKHLGFCSNCELHTPHERGQEAPQGQGVPQLRLVPSEPVSEEPAATEGAVRTGVHYATPLRFRRDLSARSDLN